MITEYNINPVLMPSQSTFYDDDKSPYLCFIGGYRSGKTHVGAEKMLKNMIMNKTQNMLVIAPTHSLLITVCIPKIEEIFKKYNINIEIKITEKVGITPFGKIYFRSGHHPESIIGFEVGGVWIDEPGVQKKESLDRSIARMSATNTTIKQVLLTGTPEPGKQGNWWEQFCENENVVIHRASTHESVEYGTIDPDYIHRLSSIYSEKLLAAYIDGLFVSIDERLSFYEFRKETHIDNWVYHPNIPIMLSWDFNVNPLCVNIAQYEHDVIHLFDEIHLSHSDTRQAVDQIIERYPDAKQYYVFGDSSARNHDTRNSKTTDMDIIVIKLKATGKYVSNRINTSNPSIRNSTNLVNGLLAPASFKPMLYVTTKCKNIIKDFLNVTGNKKQDEKNGYGHHSDGVRYLCEKVYGYRMVRRAAA